MQWLPREREIQGTHLHLRASASGIERIRAVVVQDSDGIAAALDAAMEESIAATFDPWTERDDPKTANQFAIRTGNGGRDMSREHAIGHLSQIPLGEGRTFDVDGTIVAVFRTRPGELFATQALCPHKHGPLADGLLGGTTLVCPLHDTMFDLRTGESVAGGYTLRTYPVRAAADGRIMLELVREAATAE